MGMKSRFRLRLGDQSKPLGSLFLVLAIQRRKLPSKH